MKTLNKIVLSAIVFAFLTISIEGFAQVGIGIASPNTNAMLDVTATNKGFLPPRLTTAERDALKTQLLSSNLPEDKGMLVFDTALTTYFYWEGADWVAIAATGGSYVDLTTNQTIAGMKTFTGDLTPAGRIMIPMGELNYFKFDAGTALSVNTGTASTGASGNDNMVPINPQPNNTVNFINDNFTLDGSGVAVVGAQTDSRLKYTSGDSGNKFVGRYFHIALSFSFSSVTGNTGQTFVFGVSHKDISEGTDGVVNSSKQFLTVGSAGTHQSSALHVLLWLDDGDEIGFSIGQLGGTGNVLIKSFNFVAIGM